MTDPERLAGLVSLWWRAIDDFTHLLEQVPQDQWATATDLPGWDVHAVAAHTAHLEALLAGSPHDDVEIGDAPHAHGPMGHFTEQGVVARRDRSPDDLINEIRESATTRHTRLLAEPPTDPDEAAPGVFGAIGWTMARLLRNRPLDLGMHEQDVRRAVGLPGNLDSPQVGHCVDYLAESLGYVLARKVRAAPGATVCLDVTGHAPVVAAVTDDGRGRLVAADGAADATVAVDAETFLLLAGGRGTPREDRVRLSGDLDLARSVVAALAVTP